MTFPPGTRLGPYEIRGASPVSGLGEVYEARDHERDRDVGLLVLRTDFGAEPDRLARFQREASAAALLEHPHILTVHNVGADARAAYVVSEPIAGRTLREVLASGPIPRGAGTPFVPQIADALAAAHAKGVVHGNLTPDSILFTPNGVKVVGFGLSAAMGQREATASADIAAFEAISEQLTGLPRGTSTGLPRATPPLDSARGDLERVEGSRRPHGETRSSSRWSGVAAAIGVLGVAAAIGVIGVAALIGMWLFEGRRAPATAQPESVRSEPVVTESPPGRPSPEGAGAAAPTTTAKDPAPTTSDEPATVVRDPLPTTREPEPAPTIATPVPTTPKPVRRPPEARPTIAAPVRPRPKPVPRPRQPAPTITARAATSVESGPSGIAVPPPPPAGPSRLVWLDRTGTEAGALGDAADYGHVALSPDGTRVAVSIREPGRFAGDIWIIDTQSGTRTRLTSDPADDMAPVWSPDGHRVAYASSRGGSYDIYDAASDGTEGERALIAAPGDQVAYAWTPGGFLMYQTDRPGMAPGAHTDLWARRIPGGRAFAFLRSVHRTGFPSSSPDGRRYAFVLTDSGSGIQDVYVARFPKYDGRRRVSTGGGSWPRWRADAIFYVDAENRVVSVPVASERTQTVIGAPSRVSDLAVKHGRGSPYDVSADGQRMLLNTAPEAGAETLSRRAP